MFGLDRFVSGGLAVFRMRSLVSARLRLLGCATIVAAVLWVGGGFSTPVFAEIDDVDAAKDEALSGTKTPQPLAEPQPVTDLPNAPRNKINGASLSISDLKAQTQLVAPGWLRTYATVALPPDLLLAVPDYYETALESDMRAAINDALANRGVDTIGDPDAAPFRLTYSAEVRETQSSGLRQSRLRLESDANDRQNFGSQRLPAPGNTVRPGLSLGPLPSYDRRGPVLRATIIVLDGDERIWSGFAEAELGDYRRAELTRVLVSALMRHWGENAEFDDTHFSNGPGAGLAFGEIGDGDL